MPLALSARISRPSRVIPQEAEELLIERINLAKGQKKNRIHVMHGRRRHSCDGIPKLNIMLRKYAPKRNWIS
jgi:hypothetical protein